MAAPTALISFAGISLGAATDDVAKQIRAYIPLSDIGTPVVPDWPGRTLMGTMRPDRLPDREILRRLGTLWWPTGASRFAIGHFIATGSQVDQLRAVGNAKQLLTLSDGTNTITAKMSLLPPRPLAPALTATGSNQLYLCSFVDQRLGWWQSAGSIAVNPGVTTWATLYLQIGNALGITIAAAGVPAAYLMPTAAFNSAYGPLPVLLDAVAAAVGQKVVVSLAGAVSTQTAPVGSYGQQPLAQNAQGGGFFRFVAGT